MTTRKRDLRRVGRRVFGRVYGMVRVMRLWSRRLCGGVRDEKLSVTHHDRLH